MDNKERNIDFPSSEDEAVIVLADMVINTQHRNETGELEAFDLYATTVHERLHANPQKFRARLLKGYHALLEEMQG